MRTTRCASVLMSVTLSSALVNGGRQFQAKTHDPNANDKYARYASHDGFRHHVGSNHGELSEVRVDIHSFKEMKKSDMWAKIEEIQKAVDLYRDRHQKDIEQVREEKKRWLKDWEELQQDRKKISTMNTAVRQMKQIAKGGRQADDVHLESRSGLRINEEHFKAMIKSSQWAEIEEAQAQVDSFKIRHDKNLVRTKKAKARWLEESEKLQQQLKKLSDMRSDIQQLRKVARR